MAFESNFLANVYPSASAWYMRTRTCGIFLLAVIFCFIIGATSCSNGKASRLFNEGVALNLQSTEAQKQGNFEKSADLNKQSIAKFYETLKADSSHDGVRSALAHSLYMDKQFAEALKWFKQANESEETTALNFKEMAFCNLQLGALQEAKDNFKKAFELDSSRTIREKTTEELLDVADLSFSYGEDLAQRGKFQESNDNKRLAIEVLIIAFDFDKSRKDIALVIADFSKKIGDKEVAALYREIAAE